jgi:integration host factor subunit beta
LFQKKGVIREIAPLDCSLTTEKVLATFGVERGIGMLKPELVQRVADKSLHLHRSDVEKVVNAVLEEVLTELVRRNRVEPRGFGAFAVKVKSARPGGNPKTGELVSVPETARAAFKTGMGMHCRLNADFQ